MYTPCFTTRVFKINAPNCFETLNLLLASKAVAANLNHFPEESAGTLYRGIYTRHPNTE